jgi:hypothetical protein
MVTMATKLFTVGSCGRISSSQNFLLTLQQHEYTQMPADDEWVPELAQPSDIFFQLNEINRKIGARLNTSAMRVALSTMFPRSCLHCSGQLAKTSH